MINKITEFLNTTGFYPIDLVNWNWFEIHHYTPSDQEEEKDKFLYIKQKVSNLSGIYIYFNEQGELIYIGKAKLLYDRLKSHYIESFRTVKGDTKDNRWHRFFSSHQGKVIVYWKQLEGEEYRQIVELMLSTLLKPTFLKFK